MLIPFLAALATALQSAPDKPVVPGANPPAPASEGAAGACAPARPEGAPTAGEAKRLVGDEKVKPILETGEYRLPQMQLLIEAPLPEGYPAPTPPGMIELKTYPSVRRAEYSAKGSSNFGMNVGFWPLFNHIKSRDIAMTSPVEMDYRPAGERAPLAPMKDAEGSWTMSFLYRSAKLGPTGEDGRVKVVDAPEVTVVSIGMRGPYGTGTVNAGLEALQAWFDSQQDWEPAGDPRGLNYNGPQVMQANKWSEVQVPVKRKAAAAPAGAASGNLVNERNPKTSSPE